MKHVFFIYYTCTLKYSDKLLIGTYRCFSWFVFVLGSCTCSAVINLHYRVVILYNLISTMVEYLYVFTPLSRKKPRSIVQLTDELQKFQMCLSVFYFIKYLMMKIPAFSIREPGCSQTWHSVACLADNLVKYVTLFPPEAKWKTEK